MRKVIRYVIITLFVVISFISGISSNQTAAETKDCHVKVLSLEAKCNVPSLGPIHNATIPDAAVTAPGQVKDPSEHVSPGQTIISVKNKHSTTTTNQKTVTSSQHKTTIQPSKNTISTATNHNSTPNNTTGTVASTTTPVKHHNSPLKVVITKLSNIVVLILLAIGFGLGAYVLFNYIQEKKKLN